MAAKQPILVFKGNFWQFQLMGFSILFVGNLLNYWGSVKYDIEFFSIIFSNFFVLFIGSILLRIGYKKIYRKITNPYYFIIAALIGSLLCGFFWMEFREFLYVYVFKTKEVWLLKGRQHSIIASVMEATWIPLVWSILYFGIKYWKDMVIERERAQNAVVMAQQAQLKMLRYQLNPHFLFNSLNSVQGLIHENPDLADDMVSELSDFLRLTLRYNNRISITIAEEVEIIRKYLKIEKIRYEERLQYSIRVDDNALGVEIPCFITQPLVENSIKHGLYANPDGIDLQFNISVNSTMLVIEVANSGKLSGEWKSGVGFKNVKERLQNSYPGKFRFYLNESKGMVAAKIFISLQDEKIHIDNY